MLKVNNIFYSVSGEGLKTGKPAVFIRLTGCNFRCKFCDTPWAFDEGTEKTEQEILEEVKKYSCEYVVISGGEPTVQDIKRLVVLLYKNGYKTDLETNASIFTPKLYGYLSTVVLSPKPPSSLMPTNYKILKKILRHPGACMEGFVLKIVVDTEEDYQYAKKIHLMFPQIPFIFQLESKLKIDKKKAQLLVEKVKWDSELYKRNVRVGIQIHKLIWGNKRGV